MDCQSPNVENVENIEKMFELAYGGSGGTCYQAGSACWKSSGSDLRIAGDAHPALLHTQQTAAITHLGCMQQASGRPGQFT